MKTTIELAKECKALNTDYASTFTHEQLEKFRKAVEADFVSRCEQVATIQTNGEGLYAFVRPSCDVELGTQLYALPIGYK